MALVTFDEKLNGRITNPKEGEATKLDFFFDELIIVPEGNKLHCHMWVTEATKELYLYESKKTKQKPVIPGRFYYCLDGDSKEGGVQCAYKVFAALDPTKCYKGYMKIDGSFGAATQMLAAPEMLAAMSSMFYAGMEVQPVNLKFEDCGTVEAAKGFGGGFSRGETKAEAINARIASFSALVADNAKVDEIKVGFAMFIGSDPTPEQLARFLGHLLA